MRLSVLALFPATLVAQGRAVELHVGRWLLEPRVQSYEFRLSSPLGPLTQGLTLTALISDSLGRRRAFYGAGYEILAPRPRSTLAPYALAGAALGLATDTATQQLGVLWSVGGGLKLRPFSWLAIGAEGRYRVERRGGLSESGLGGAVGVAIGLGKGARRAERGGARLDPPERVTGNAADVVRTALGVLGTPYQWGGTADNGFDCSGLIQYSYGQHGIRLPRKSHDQAHVGAEVTPVVEALRPGDILLFAVRPGTGVTHVGMYVGEQKFIHSATDGVKLSLLDPHDPDGAFWMTHWLGVRRVIP